MQKNNIFIFCGSFDPFHDGHLDIISNIDKKIHLIPTYNPLKNKGILSISERIHLLKSLKIPNIIIEEFTASDPNKYQYMSNILTELSHNHDDNLKFSLIMGYDTYQDILSWKDISPFLPKINCIVFSRDNKKIIKLPNISTTILLCNIKNTSSTQIREAIIEGNLSYLTKNMPKEALDFLIQKFSSLNHLKP